MSYPYSTTGVLFFRRGERNFRCTASVVSKRLIATAGHCVFGADLGFSTDFLFIPAFFEGLAPFGTWDGVEVFVTDEWVADPKVPNVADFGIVVLADSNGLKVGDATGWLGYKTRGLENNHVKILGYPGNHDNGALMHQVDTGDWFIFDNPVGAVYGSDMRDGSSGGPWIQNFGVKAHGQRGGRNKATNRLVGVTSATSVDRKVMLLQSSIPGPSFKQVFDQACDQAAGNCTKKGKPSS